MKHPESESGHILIVVMVFLMLSSVLIMNAVEILKEDRLSTLDFESGMLDAKNPKAPIG